MVLIQFRVENHRSLRDDQPLSLVAAKNVGSGQDNCLIRPKGLNEALLPAIALYGANASGKTNVLLALEFMKHAVRDSQRLWEPQDGIPQGSFALSDRKLASSRYEVDIFVGGVRLVPLYAWLRGILCDFPVTRIPEEMWPFEEIDAGRRLVYGKDSSTAVA